MFINLSFNLVFNYFCFQYIPECKVYKEMFDGTGCFVVTRVLLRVLYA